MPTPTVAIVILNWNGKKFLQQFLPSVVATRFAGARIVVADNASTDDSLSFLAEHYPDVSVIRLLENHGFAGGYNKALQQVQADYYVLLNSDVAVASDWLEAPIALLEKDAGVGACQPKILSFEQPTHFEYAGAAGGWIDQYGYPFARGRVFDVCEEDKAQYNDVAPIFWASGAALIIRSQIFHQLNGFDPFFFAHMEEIDLCWRIQLAGYAVYACPQSVVYHVGGGTLPKSNPRKTFLNFRNNLVMLAKNLPVAEALWKLPLRMLLDVVAAAKALAGGDAKYFAAVMKAILAFWKWFFSNGRSQVRGKRAMSTLPGVYKGLIVADYFLRKKTTFGQLVEKK